MQKVINVIALLSGLTSLAVIGGGAYLYMNKDVLVENAREKVTVAVTEAITDALPALVNKSMPEMPKTTGPAMPF